MSSEESYLLPKIVVPNHYDIQLQIDLNQLKFSGDETIAVTVVSPIRELRLHCVDLTLSDVSLCCDGGNRCVVASSVVLDAKSQTAVITLAEEVPAGDAELHLSFAAPIDTQMRGLYRSKYTGSDGEERWMAVTQFEAASARRCFPCWDEPERKATFSLTLTAPKDRTALSNMPEETSKDDPSDGSRRIIKFQKTPKMSTYLVAIVVGEYDVVERDIESGVKVRVFTPKGRSIQGEFALDVASRALPYYSDYFQIPYPLPKLDLISVPDFSAGAMENWGLVTFRESLLLVDPVQSSAQNKQRVMLVIAHELAHQWFGNLVTMMWWTHLWLNEGYANFSQTLCGDFLFPDYQVWTQFLSSSFIPALQLDSLDSTHPVEVDVDSPDTVDEIFDEISYDKGASVIRMLHRYLGEEDFRRGMALYLKRHQYSNTCTEDLWRALGEVSGKPVEKVMSAWTRQDGFPMVSVSAADKEGSTVLSLSQTRFFLSGKKDQTNSLWAVPVDAVCSVDTEKRSVLLEGSAGELVLPQLPDNGWVKINSGACGFYRTKYSPELLNRLIPLVRSKTLTVLDRINLLDDLFALVKSNHAKTDQFLDLVQAYKGEEDYSVYMCLRNCTLSVSGLLSHRKELKKLMCPLVREVYAPIYQKLGWEPSEGESFLDRLLRPLILITLGENGEQSVIEKCQTLFANHVAGKMMIPADLRTCVYKTCMLAGNQATLETLIKLYRAAEDQEERDRLSRCMGATSDLDLLQRVVEFTLKEIRPQDIPFVLFFAAGNSAEGGKFVWQYFKANYNKFVEMYADSDLMIRLVKLVSGNFASEADALDVESFFAKLPSPPGMRGIQQNLESIRLKAAWLDRDYEVLKAYFSKWQQ